MLFIGVAIVVAIGLALIVSSDVGGLVGLTQTQLGQLIPAVVILVVLSASLFSRRYKFGEIVSNLVVWVGIVGVLLVGYTYRDDLTGVASRVFGELLPGQAVVDPATSTVSFRSGLNGHFQINALVDGTEIRTVFDTGASAVVLTNADAKKVGIDTASLQYNVAVSTANGTGRAAQVTLSRLEVGTIERRKVRAFVAEAGALDTSLLGMSFLGTLSRYAVSGSSLELTD
jgi:aspartyl protease family protein